MGTFVCTSTIELCMNMIVSIKTHKQAVVLHDPIWKLTQLTGKHKQAKDKCFAAWRKEIKGIKDAKFVLCPIHTGKAHWILAVVCIAEQSVMWLDSCYSKSSMNISEKRQQVC